MATKRSLKIVTPVGKLMYATVTGQGKPKYKAKGKFEYQSSIIVTKKQGKVILKDILDYFNDNKPKNYKGEPANIKNIMRKIEGDKDNVMFTFKTLTEFKDKESKKGKMKQVEIGVFNKHKQP
ncbi:hypothetical protein KY321_01385, partial [Candidatus Woesearchaeota archaeon]|nr:hypothetical protein [Candidatus Woesearchaeota archaeon]